jgi:hypothetical protein
MDEWLVSRRLTSSELTSEHTRRGFHRQRMGTVIAELRLMRQHSEAAPGYNYQHERDGTGECFGYCD